MTIIFGLIVAFTYALIGITLFVFFSIVLVAVISVVIGIIVGIKELIQKHEYDE